ncbi:MAG: protein translocase subunit SecF [Elusimicrobiota bacterium]
MELIKNTKIDFVAKRYIFFVLSGALILAGIISLAVKGGPNLGIDFVGGSLLQLSFDQPVQMDTVRECMREAGFEKAEMQSAQGNNLIIRIKKSDITQEEFAARALQAIQAKYPQHKINTERAEYVGPAIGRHLYKQAIFAMLFSMLGIIIYVAFRFHSGVWGTAGVVALCHDVFVVVGIFSLLDKEITLTIIAALLTLAGFSINDTIVIFDRMRENLKLRIKDNFGTIINVSVNQTLSRTVITSLTVFIVTVAIFFYGGEVIHDFAFAMLIGVFIGSYSTIFVASPMVYEWEEYKKRRTVAMKTQK